MPKIEHTRYGEKKVSKNFGLTPTAAKLLKELATELGLSASELIERIARREIGLTVQMGEY